MALLPPIQTVLFTVAILTVTFLLYGFVKLRKVRGQIRRLQNAGLQIAPDHSSILGHLLSAKRATKSLPKGVALDYGMSNIAKEFPDGAFYIDMWPISVPFLIITTPAAAIHLQKYSAPLGHPVYFHSVFNEMCAGENLITVKLGEWKRWRGLFNPSFGENYVQQLAAGIAEEVAVFTEILRGKAQEDKVLLLERLTSKLTFDIISRTTLDLKMNHQKKDHPLAVTLRRQVELVPFGGSVSGFYHINPLRYYAVWNNKRRMRQIIGDELEKRFAEAKGMSPADSSTPAKSIVSLALDSYINESEKTKTSLDKRFKAVTTSNIALLMIGGYETTSTTICYCYHNLYTHPHTVTRIRAEHDEVFGTNTSPNHIISLLEKEPERLNRLPYTVAVIKESLRLYSPASRVRQGSPSVSLTDDAGKSYPTANCMIVILHMAMHRNPRYWKEPNSFMPERWLVSEDDPLYPVKGAWRAFEYGPKNCIGQALAMIELRIVLLMTVRDFDFQPAYSETDSEVWGSKAWMAEAKGIGGKPHKEYPTKVALAKRG